MRKTSAAAVLLALACIAPQAVRSGDASDKELKKFEGTWAVTSIVYNGDDFSEKLKLRFVFKGKDASVEGNDEIKKSYAKLRFKVDPSTTPKIVDITVADGTLKDTVMEGIYDVKDGQLRLCIKLTPNERPGEFAAPAGSSSALLVLKREP